MATEKQINANRLNAQKSTGPKTAEGKVAVAQNAVKHGLFAHDNVIQCENQADFDRFREELIAGLAPVGGVETMMAERIVSLSWRLKRVERMNYEVIDVMIAKIETNSSESRWRQEAGLLDPENGKSELGLGWAIIKDFSGSNVLERLLMYEKRIESSLYKAMNELQKLKRLRREEESETEKKMTEFEKQSQFNSFAAGNAEFAEQTRDSGLPNIEKQTQFSLSAVSANPAVNAKQSQNPVSDRTLAPDCATHASSTTL
jgi:hypothetical protein